jgi:hypothetical protein
LQTFTDLRRWVDRLDLGDRRATAAREIFERWCAAAEDQVLSALAARLATEAAALAARTGVKVRLSASSGERSSSESVLGVRALSIELGSSRVEVYSVRGAAESPRVHLGVLRGATSTRFPVMATVPGCLVVRREDGGIGLIVAPIPAATPSERRATSIDAVALRAFELLIGAHQSTRDRRRDGLASANASQGCATNALPSN